MRRVPYLSCGEIKSNNSILNKILALNYTRNIEVIVCEAGEISLAYLYGKENPAGEIKSVIYSKDGLPLQVGIEIALQLHSPQLFMLNIFKGLNKLPVTGLKGRYVRAIHNELCKFIAKHNIVNLSNTPNLKNHCCDVIEQNISSVFRHDGFEVIKVRSVTFYNPDFGKLKEQKASRKIDGAHQILEYKNKKQELENREKWIQLRHKEKELKIKQSALEQQSNLAQQKIDTYITGKKLKHGVDTYEDQVDLWDKLRNYKNQNLSDKEIEFILKQERKLMEHEFNKKKMALLSELELQRIRDVFNKDETDKHQETRKEIPVEPHNSDETEKVQQEPERINMQKAISFRLMSSNRCLQECEGIQ